MRAASASIGLKPSGQPESACVASVSTFVIPIFPNRGWTVISTSPLLKRNMVWPESTNHLHAPSLVPAGVLGSCTSSRIASTALRSRPSAPSEPISNSAHASNDVPNSRRGRESSHCSETFLQSATPAHFVASLALPNGPRSTLY